MFSRVTFKTLEGVDTVVNKFKGNFDKILLLDCGLDDTMCVSQFITDYPQGKTIQIYYDRNNPQEISFTKDYSAGFFVLLGNLII